MFLLLGYSDILHFIVLFSSAFNKPFTLSISIPIPFFNTYSLLVLSSSFLQGLSLFFLFSLPRDFIYKCFSLFPLFLGDRIFLNLDKVLGFFFNDSRFSLWNSDALGVQIKGSLCILHAKFSSFSIFLDVKLAF